MLQRSDGKFCLTITGSDERTGALFEERDLQGGGYTWEGIVTALIQIHMPEVLPLLDIGAEADNMYAYCRDQSVLEKVAELGRAACADHELLESAIEHAGEDLE